MKTSFSVILLAALLASGCQSVTPNPNPAAVGDITVEFKDSDKYTDARDSVNGPTSQTYLDELGKYLKESAARQLTAGQKLTVTVTDIDLAGDIPPGQLENVRIVKDIYMPRMELHFQLLGSDGAVVKEGDRRLLDMNFMQTLIPTTQNDPLRYDKALLANWVRNDFN